VPTQRITAIALVLGVLVTTPASTEENRGSAGYLLPHCNSWLQVASFDLGAVNVIGVFEALRTAPSK